MKKSPPQKPASIIIMSQPSVASFFHSRKRTAIDDIFAAKNKANAVDAVQQQAAAVTSDAADASSSVSSVEPSTAAEPAPAASTRSGRRTPVPVAVTAASTRPRRAQKSTAATGEPSKRSAAASATASEATQPKIVKFTLAGHLSPKKRMQTGSTSAPKTKRLEVTNVAAALFANREANNAVLDRGQRTPTKSEQAAQKAAERAAEQRTKLSMQEIKERVTRSSRLTEMRASMDKLKALQEQRERIIASRSSTMKTADKHNNSDAQTDRAARILGKGLKQFDTIEMEILSRYDMEEYLSMRTAIAVIGEVA